MLTLDVLKAIRLGSSVAEFDEYLDDYFVETDTFTRLVSDRTDTISGDKGTGKTALFRILRKRYTTIDSLGTVEVVPAFNIEGTPVFQRLSEGDPLEEGQYQTLWKSYFFSLGANWLLGLWDEADWTEPMRELSDLLERTGLSTADDSPSTVFSSIVNLFRRLLHPRSAEMAVTIGPHGMPVVVPRVEFEPETTEVAPTYVPHDEAFECLNRALDGVDLSLWLVMDRLDEAFAGTPAAEIPALRALLRTYLDLLPYQHVRVKLFLRKDLFRRVIEGGFVNLTHVNAKRVDIIWDDAELWHMLYLRLRESQEFLSAIGIDRDDADAIFAKVFPPKVDPGTRKPTTYRWIMGRIRDGNDAKPPRNLIDLVQKSLDWAIRREERERSEYTDQLLLPAEALKAGLSALSKQRVEDTLLAEIGDEAYLIERFRSGKAEHNLQSLSDYLGLEGDELNEAVRFLRDVGFLESVGTSIFKVPMLYRDGLGITQGRAFTSPGEVANDDEEEED